MKRTVKVDPFLYCQPEKLFVEQLKKPVHFEKPEYFNKREADEDEAQLNGAYLLCDFQDELLQTIYDDFENFLSVYEISGNKYPIITKKGNTSKFESYKIITDDKQTIVLANDTEGIRRGLVYIEDEMRRREGAFLQKGETERTPFSYVITFRSDWETTKGKAFVDSLETGIVFEAVFLRLFYGVNAVLVPGNRYFFYVFAFLFVFADKFGFYLP